MSRKYPDGYYVYLHRRKSDGQVFYVGKGIGKRAWESYSYSRNEWWNNVSDKHGVEIEVVKSGMSEPCSLTLEKILIAKYRAIGSPLVNLTDGGDGCSGLVNYRSTTVMCSNGMEFPSYTHAAKWLTREMGISANHSTIIAACNGALLSAHGFAWWVKGEIEKEYIPPRMRMMKKIHCSNGMSFDGAVDAVSWLHGIGITGAESGALSKACSGSRVSAYGMSWWHKGEEPKEYINGNELNSISRYKSVICSNGMEFQSGKEAVSWLRSCGFPSASTGSISDACNGKRLSAYGFAWWFHGDQPKKYSDQKRRVMCSNGMSFETIRSAVYWLKENGYPNASGSSISAVCQGKRNKTYGHTWKYADEQD